MNDFKTELDTDLDVTNYHLVCTKGNDQIFIMNPPTVLTPESALRFAAWLVAVAEPNSKIPFKRFLEEVKNT